VIPLVGTSWKMNLTSAEADSYLRMLRSLLDGLSGCETFVLPPFTSIWVARERLEGSGIGWGAQDVSADDDGAHTGDVSAAMLADLGCRYVEVGHSERRRDHGETDDAVARKVRQVVGHAMVPVICVGEPTFGAAAAAIEHVTRQVEHALDPLTPAERAQAVIAYEPVWAIGAGARAADPVHIGAVQRHLHTLLEAMNGGPTPRVIYGGSVDEGTAGAILATDGVDGLFVGRAALDPTVFAGIVRIAATQAGARIGATDRPVA
jgi:L-erythrulose 1-phosphate isomerase